MNDISPSQTATAHQFWDYQWQSDAGRKPWSAPEADVVSCISRLVEKGARKGLDLGCGVGRHTLAMAELGMNATGLDASPAGLAHLALEAKARNLAVTTREGNIHELPFEDGSFDYVLSFNVIYHGTRREVERAISEIARLLPKGGIFQGTLLSKRNAGYGKGTEIDPGTFVLPAEEGSDKDHPHFYCDAGELVDLLSDFELLSLVDIEQKKPGSWHWQFSAEKR